MEAELNSLNRKLYAAGRATSHWNEYAILKSDNERYSYTLRLLEEFKVEPKIKFQEKSSSESERYRKEGNELFVSEKSDDKRDKILELYNKCIVFAEPNSPELAYAYGNRSELLFKARLYDHCLCDIKRALSIDCPPNLKFKLLTRRIHCLTVVDKLQSNTNEKSLESHDEAVEEAQICIERMALEEPLKEKFHDNLKNVKTSDIGPLRKMFDEEKYLPPTPTDNPEIPGASGALKISYDEKFGRRVMSTRKILPGEVLSVQKGYATILAPEHLYTHCSNCLRQTWSGVPCDRCVYAVYCDEACRDEAWSYHHDVECAVIGAMLNLEFNLLSLMCLRLAIRAVREAGGLEALKKKLETIASWPDPRTRGFTGVPPILVESDYSSVYTLTRNSEKRTGIDLFDRSFNSVFIVYCVATMTEFLGEKLPPDWGAIKNNPWSVFLGGLITRHQQIVSTNAHMVTETNGIFPRIRGSSIIPFLSLFNHCCDEMIKRVHYGRHVVVYALQTIEAGEQVYDNYGMYYDDEPLYSRQLRLHRQYFFTCQCAACIKYWPTFEIPSLSEQLLDQRQRPMLKKALKNYGKYFLDVAMNCEIVDKLYMIKDVKFVLKTLYEHVELPCREVNKVVENLKRMYGLLSIRYQSLCEWTDNS